jgi:hypothetical protein
MGVVRSSHIDIYDNTCWNDDVSVTLPVPYNNVSPYQRGEVVLVAGADVRVVNNIFYGNAAANMLYALNQNPVTWSVNSNIVWDYNILYAGQGAVPIGPHDLVLNPMFSPVGPGPNFHLIEGSPAVGSGTSLLVPPTDFEGKPRYPARIDRGAYYGW